MSASMNIYDLPDSMIENIMKYLSYDEIAKKRIISKRWDYLCQGMLNRGFIKMTKLHQVKLKEIKSQLPRRESERRVHPLARHSDILTCIETRISMLNMTYVKFMEMDLCCFIPGKIIDEVYYIFKRLNNNSLKTLRAHEILQELRDISSMAIEHFEDQIAYRLKKNIVPMDMASNSSYSGVVAKTKNCKILPTCGRAEVNSVKVEKLKKSYSVMSTRFNKLYQISKRQAKINETANRSILGLTKQIRGLRRRLEEVEVKNMELSASIIQLKIDAALNKDNTASDTKPKNIRPRSATIILKRRIEESEKLKEESKRIKFNNSA